jgi:acyl dehydratase
MPLDPAAVGFETPPHDLAYDWRTTVLYALGIGAKRAELDYLYEGRGPKVFPTMAVLPAYGPMMELIGRTGGNVNVMVHSAQAVRLLAPMPPAGTFRTVGRISGIYDLKRLAQVVCVTRSEVAGVPVCETEWTLLFREGGGFGGPRPPKRDVPKAEAGAPPLFEHEEATSEEQALLYRLSGDTNPLHADPDFARAVGFEAGPILHGLATFGFVARALVRHACDGDAGRLRFLTAQFRKPVWPGDALRTVGHRVGDRVVARVCAGGRPDPVVTDCWAEITKA